MNRDRLLSALRQHAPFNTDEHSHLVRLEGFLDGAPEPFSRQNLALGSDGHITGSAALLNATGDAMALIWHEKLSRWLQPGGHCEPEMDGTVTATARRELLEETGLPESAIELKVGVPFDVDVHYIPARPDGSEPGHYHYDVRFLFQLTEPVEFPNGVKAKWVSLSEAASLDDDSVARLAKKAQDIIAA
ncbi:MAG: NUDIX domain-containing protein [Armatimonas sp.]